MSTVGQHRIAVQDHRDREGLIHILISFATYLLFQVIYLLQFLLMLHKFESEEAFFEILENLHEMVSFYVIGNLNMILDHS